MSYILEALKKSERERQKAQSPGLPDLIVEGPPKPRSQGPWIAVAVALLGANAGLLFYLSNTPKTESFVYRPPLAVVAPPPQTTPAPSAPPAATDPEKEALNRKLQELESRVAKIDSTKAAELHTKPTVTASEPTNPPIAALPVPRKPAVVPTPPVKAAAPRTAPGEAESKTPRRGLPEPDAGEAVDEEYPEAPMPSSVAMTGSRPMEPVRESLPSVAELPPALRQKLPALKINLLAYSSSPGERFAVVDMVRYSPGARLPGGALLLDIQPDGLVLELDGEKFKLNHR